MAFVSSFTGISVAAPAHALVSPRRGAVRHARSARMNLAPVAQEVSVKLNEVALVLASREGDFGGYTGPILGLLTIGVIIAVLTPPVKE
ncbi:unnamed protein product [Agarophyton chilense]